MTQPAATTRRSAHLALATCAALLLIHAVLGYFAVKSKSPTYDEPLHATSAWMNLRQGDFSVDPEDPPLWKYWAALPNSRDALKPDRQSKLYQDIFSDIRFEWEIVLQELYRSENSPDADAFIMRSRVMMIILSMGLGAMTGWWAWRLGGMWAAVVATFVYALEPNFLAHGPLVKNDVPLTLVMLALAIGVWRAGVRATVWNVLSIGLLCGAALSVKFSGLVLGPAVAILVIGRALLRAPWKCFGHDITTRLERFAVACGILASAVVISWVTIWASYGFRFAPTPDPNLRLNIRQMLRYTAINQLINENGGIHPSEAQLATWRPNAFARAALWLEKNHMLPQSWLIGLLFTYQSALARPSFLLDSHSMLGWWYYFPLAILFKTPLTTLAASAGAVALFFAAWRKRAGVALPHGAWTVMSLSILPGFFMFMAMRSNLNLGVRHVLPVYPFIFIAIGIAAAWGRALWPRAGKLAIAVAAVGLSLESLAAFPNYLAFFHVAVGGSRGGIHLLSDSNLDWGQDLKLIAQWQQEHPGTPLYLMYFGFADPWAYGIDYRNFLQGYKYGAVFEPGSEPGVLMISATHLQGVYYEQRDIRDFLARLRQIEPLEVLGGTIYVYPWPPPVPMPARALQELPPVDENPKSQSQAPSSKPAPSSK